MVVAATGELRVVNPATLELVGTVPTSDPARVQGTAIAKRDQRVGSTESPKEHT
jgi:hypothetical protein